MSYWLTLNNQKSSLYIPALFDTIKLNTSTNWSNSWCFKNRPQ